VVRVRHRRRTSGKARAGAVGTPVSKKGVSSPNRVGAVDAPRVDVPRLNLSPRRSDNSVANNNDNFPRPQSARAVMAALPFSADGADDGRATVVACFFLPPSEAFHGLEKKLMAIGAFDTAGQIKRQLFEAIRCQSSADDYELRTRANRPLEASGTTLLAGGEPPKSPRRASAISGAERHVVSRARRRAARSRRAAAPARCVEIDGVRSSIASSTSDGAPRLSPGESYFDLSMGEGGAASSGAGGGSTSALVASPRRVTGRAYSRPRVRRLGAAGRLLQDGPL
jgi:hypothetical protein